MEDEVSNTNTVITESALEPQSRDFQEASTANPHSQDLSIDDNSEAASGGDLKRLAPMVTMTIKQASPSNFQDELSGVKETVVKIDHKYSLDRPVSNTRLLTLQGPTINEFPLEVQVFQHMSFRDTFEVSSTLRNKKTRRMYLNTQRLQIFAGNLCRWMAKPYPIVVDRSTRVLHCMAIQVILWEFTKGDHTLSLSGVEDRFLAGMKEIKQFTNMSYVAATCTLGLIPLISDTRSLHFLFFLVPIVVYILLSETSSHLICYYVKSLFCPVFIKVYGFDKLYKSRSFFTWCNEFRKQRVFNPAYFLINQEYANSFLDKELCFDIIESVELPVYPTMDLSFELICEGWPLDLESSIRRETQHAYKLKVTYDAIKDGCHNNLKLSFCENNELLDYRFFGSTKIERIHLIKKVFNYYSYPSFGGYVEMIYPSFRFYFAHCPRFLDVCTKIISDDAIPTLLVAQRKPNCRLIIGDSFLSATS